jgi:hypothetical protein
MPTRKGVRHRAIVITEKGLKMLELLEQGKLKTKRSAVQPHRGKKVKRAP